MYTNKHNSPRLLLIEDDPISILIATELLKNDFDLTIAMNSSTALELTGVQIFDAILMDIFLDDEHMDGIKLMHAIKNMPYGKNCKFFAISAYVSPAEFDRYIGSGFSFFFEKPYIQEQIVSTIYESLHL